MTVAIDYASDGRRIFANINGFELLGKITGSCYCVPSTTTISIMLAVG